MMPRSDRPTPADTTPLLLTALDRVIVTQEGVTFVEGYTDARGARQQRATHYPGFKAEYVNWSRVAASGAVIEDRTKPEEDHLTPHQRAMRAWDIEEDDTTDLNRELPNSFLLGSN